MCCALRYAALPVGLSILLRDEDTRVACVGQRVVLIFVAFLTATYQILLTQAFQPLFRYLPVILESGHPLQDRPRAAKVTETYHWYTFMRRPFEGF